MLPNDELTAKCACWCQQDVQPEYDSYRDYFETHAHGADCNFCMEYDPEEHIDWLEGMYHLVTGDEIGTEV